MTRDIIDSPFLFKKWCSKLKPVYSLDFETTSLNWLDLEIIGWSICDGKQACYVNVVSDFDGKVCTHTKYKKELLDILEYYINEAQLIIFHNASFDMLVLKKYGIEL